MGVGRSIAVLTSGGDAQGKRTTIIQSSLWLYNCKKNKTEMLLLHVKIDPELLPASPFEVASSLFNSRQQSIMFTYWLR